MSRETPFSENPGPHTMVPVTKLCPECHARFTCGATAGQLHCWCCDLPHIMEMNASAGCLCPTCLRREIDRRMQGALGDSQKSTPPSAEAAL